jgi:hypothetical protein
VEWSEVTEEEADLSQHNPWLYVDIYPTYMTDLSINIFAHVGGVGGLRVWCV